MAIESRIAPDELGQALRRLAKLQSLPVWNPNTAPITSDGLSNTKMAKATTGIRSAIIYLASGTTAEAALGIENPRSTCPYITYGCGLACLVTAGHGQAPNVRAARIGRTLAYLNHREWFINKVTDELERRSRYAHRIGSEFVFRPDGTSELITDYLSHASHWFDIADRVYGYVKNYRLYMDWLTHPERYPENLSLTFSRSEVTTPEQITAILDNHGTMSVVFDRIPDRWDAAPHAPVEDATKHDWRWRDNPGTIQALVALGRAKKDTTGFVVRHG